MIAIDSERIASLIDAQLARYPASHVDDVYKLLYQAILGPEHLVADREAFAARLRDELMLAEAAAEEPFWEPVRPDQELGRLHLRPFKTAGGDPEALLAACLRTAKRSWGTLAELQAAWRCVARGIEAGHWPNLDLAEARRLAAELAAEGYPARHHSALFRASYRPAYRLVAARELAQLRLPARPPC